MPERDTGIRAAGDGVRRSVARRLPAVFTRRWCFPLAVVAGALALLVGGVEAAVSGAAASADSVANRSDDPVQEAVESRDGRIRFRMAAHRGTTATSMVFEVHLRDRTWMTRDDRLMRLVVRDVPEGIDQDDRSAIVAATTLPGSATGFTFFTATLDVTRLPRGHYLASVELLGAAPSRPAAHDGNVIDRATELYAAPDPAITTPCCPPRAPR